MVATVKELKSVKGFSKLESKKWCAIYWQVRSVKASSLGNQVDPRHVSALRRMGGCRCAGALV